MLFICACFCSVSATLIRPVSDCLCLLFLRRFVMCFLLLFWKGLPTFSFGFVFFLIYILAQKSFFSYSAKRMLKWLKKQLRLQRFLVLLISVFMFVLSVYLFYSYFFAVVFVLDFDCDVFKKECPTFSFLILFLICLNSVKIEWMEWKERIIRWVKMDTMRLQVLNLLKWVWQMDSLWFKSFEAPKIPKITQLKQLHLKQTWNNGGHASDFLQSEYCFMLWFAMCLVFSLCCLCISWPCLLSVLFRLWNMSSFVVFLFVFVILLIYK